MAARGIDFAVYSPSPSLLRLAEDLNSYMPLRPGDFRIETDCYVVTFSATEGQHGTVVQRLRLASTDIAKVLAEIRQAIRKAGRSEALFEIGPSATPEDLDEQLRSLGLTPFALEKETVSLLLSDAAPDWPPPWHESVRVEKVDGVDAFRRSQEVFWQCFGYVPKNFEEAIHRDYACYKASPQWIRFAASIGDKIVGVGDVAMTEETAVLCGGATLPKYRGLGVYRALLAARYKEACLHGVPRLLAQSGHLSQPILRSLGFQALCTVKILHDKL